jgi:hypothetical protein
MMRDATSGQAIPARLLPLRASRDGEKDVTQNRSVLGSGFKVYVSCRAVVKKRITTPANLFVF